MEGSGSIVNEETILVTGGSGFSSSNFIRHVLKKYEGIRIVNYDALTYAGNPENLIDVGKDYAGRYSFVHGDIADADGVRRLFQKFRIDRVVNFAAETHVDRSILDASPFLRTNVLGTKVLLEMSRDSGVKLYMQISTDEVYGSLEEGVFAHEGFPLCPSSPYAASKAAADMFVLAYGKTFDLPVVISRSSNLFGPYQFPEKFIPLMITNAIEGRKLPVYGDGRNIRDWIYVEDVCDAIARILLDGTPGNIYNIGGNNHRTNIEVVKSIIRLVDRPESLITFIDDRKGHDIRYAVDNRKIRDELGWEISTDFEIGLRKTVEWYRDNAGWVASVKSDEYRRYYDRQYNIS